MIHPTAVVDPRAEIGAGVTIGPHVCIEADVVIGDGCVIGPHAVIMRYATLGPNCRVHPGAVVGNLPQDLSFTPQTVSHVRIGAGCTIREGVTIHRGTKEGSVTEAGDGCFLMANSHLAHNVRIGRRVILANGALLAGYVEVGDSAFISGNVVVHQFVQVGRLAMLGGGAAVSKDVPPFCMVRPAVLNTVIGTNVVGLRRAGFTGELRRDIRRAFKLLYKSGLNANQAAAKIRETFASGPALELAEFVEQSKRGICPSGYTEDEEEE